MRPAKLSVAELLFHPDLACGFEPFEAVRMLELLANVGREPERPWREVEAVLKFRTHATLAFPASLIAQILPAANQTPAADETLAAFPRAEAIRRRYADRPARVPVLVGNFYGLVGPHGALPISYTRTLCEIDLDPALKRTSTRTALRDWFDLFNHQMTALLFRAWEKYRMPVGYLRRTWHQPTDAVPAKPDKVTQVLFSVIGLGTPALRNRLSVEASAAPEAATLARINDLALLKYAGALARRRPGASELKAILSDYFGVPVRVDVLSGQWLDLPVATRTRLDDRAALGQNAVAGERMWDAGSKFRLRIGPMDYTTFVSLLPDPLPVPERKGVYLLSQLTRLYVGPELDFEIQLVLWNHAIPDCVMQDVGPADLGLRLGWNTWLTGDAMPDEVDDMRFDAVFAIG